MGMIEMLQRNVSVNDETVAKGFCLAWTAVVAADGKIDKKELLLLNNFAKSSTATKKFYNEQWIAGAFEEALKLLNEGGLSALYSAVASHFANAAEGDPQVLLYSLMHLACIDGDFSEKEMDAVNDIVETLEIGRKDVLLTGMIYAARTSQR
jgi:tellurite resistance protein